MNKIINIYRLIIIAVLLGIVFTGCEKDNFDPPKVKLTGKVTYNGESIGVKGKGKEETESGETVRLQLWQKGMTKDEYMRVNLAQDGSYSALLFDGDYSLVARDANGPWENRHDTVHFSVRGKNIVVDYPVIPFYTISDVQYTIENNILKATFNVTEVGESDGIESVSLIVNRTTFVDLNEPTDKTTLPAVSPGNISLSLNIANHLENEHALYARVAVKIRNIQEAVYSNTVYKIK